MKKLALSVLLVSSLFSGVTTTKQDCIESFQSEILDILHKDNPKTVKEQAINDINKNMIEKCDTLSETKTSMKDSESEECIEKFENEIMKIILSKPESDEKKKEFKKAFKTYEQKCD